MTLNPYLALGGNCRTAFEFYRSVFGGDYSILQTFGEGPDDMEVADHEVNNIMHVSLPIGESVLMGSDVPASYGTPIPPASNVSISYEPPNRREANRVFGMLSDGGTVTMPLGEMFWGSYFGACIDKFGTNWMINCQPEE
jgi:PhnB protein